MSHLSPERLAALADETPTPVEAAHVTTCDACTAELAAHRKLSRLAVAAGVMGGPPSSRFDTLLPRLVAEGLVARPDRAAIARRWTVRIAAAFALVVIGGLAGRLTAPKPQSLAQVLGPDTTAFGQPVSTFRSPDDAVKALSSAQRTYQTAAAFLAAQDTSAHFIGLNQDTYRTRLQALDEIAAATRVALYRAPQDPVLNQYYLNTLTAREATMGQMRLASATVRTY